MPGQVMVKMGVKAWSFMKTQEKEKSEQRLGRGSVVQVEKVTIIWRSVWEPHMHKATTDL